MNFVFERLKNVFNAALGKSNCLCGGHCLANHDLESPYPEADSVCFAPDPLGEFINLEGMDPEIKAILIGLASPAKQEELLKELEAAKGCDCGCEPTDETGTEQCVHLDYIPVCHMKEGDSKPETCAASTCPVRAYQCALEEMQKKAAMIAYG